MAYNDLRILYLYEFKLKHNGAEAERRLETAFGYAIIGQRTLRRWFEKFRQNDFDLSRGPRHGLNYTKSSDNERHELCLLKKNGDFKFHQLKDLDKLMLYEYKIGRSPALIVKNINEQMGKGSIAQATVEEWFEKFRNNNHVVTINVDSRRMSDVTEKSPKRKTSVLAAKEAIAKLSTTQNGKMKKLKREAMAKTKTKKQSKAGATTTMKVTEKTKTPTKATTTTTKQAAESSFKIKMQFNGKKKKK